jgi:hypothetical protein
MDHLSKEQMHLLQQNLTYEVYEQFMDMFKGSGEDELIPGQDSFNPDVTIEDQVQYIIEVAKEHPYWGEQFGWGDNRVYIHLPKDLKRVTWIRSHSLKWLYERIPVWYNIGRQPGSMINADSVAGCFKGTHRSHLMSFLDSQVGSHREFNKGRNPGCPAAFCECLPVTN